MSEIQAFLVEYRRLLEERHLVLPEPANELIGRYFFLLQHENKKSNLTGYKTISEFIDYHLLDTLKLAETLTIASDLKLLDVGTGCGVPGLLLQILFPECHVGLLETAGKKAEFLEKAKTYLKLNNVLVIQGRAEDLGRLSQWRETWDIVTARALGSFSSMLELTAPFVKVGGLCVYPRGTEEDVSREKEISKVLGMEWNEEKIYTLPSRENRFRLILLKKVASTPEKYPRKPGQIQKRPL